MSNGNELVKQPNDQWEIEEVMRCDGILAVGSKTRRIGRTDSPNPESGIGCNCNTATVNCEL